MSGSMACAKDIGSKHSQRLARSAEAPAAKPQLRSLEFSACILECVCVCVICFSPAMLRHHFFLAK